MKNITTEQKSMKNIEIMKNITAIEKTAIAKITANITAKITAKITATALLFFLALFTLTTNLKAQAVQDNSKSGFFAGFVVLDGFQVDSTKSVTTSETTSYRVTGYSNETTRIDATGFFCHCLKILIGCFKKSVFLIKLSSLLGETEVMIIGKFKLFCKKFM